jgi:hypothetical protein
MDGARREGSVPKLHSEALADAAAGVEETALKSLAKGVVEEEEEDRVDYRVGEGRHQRDFVGEGGRVLPDTSSWNTKYDWVDYLWIIMNFMLSTIMLNRMVSTS